MRGLGKTMGRMKIDIMRSMGIRQAIRTRKSQLSATAVLYSYKSVGNVFKYSQWQNGQGEVWKSYLYLSSYGPT